MQKIMSTDARQIYQKWNLPDMDFNKKKQQGDMSPKEDIEKLLQDSYQKGLLDGQQLKIDEIKHELKQEYDTKYAEKLGYLEGYINQFYHPWLLVNQEVEAYLLQLTVAIVKKLLRSELSTKPEFIVNIIHESIALLPEVCKKVQLFLNANDYNRINDCIAEINNKDLDIDFQVDDNLTEGECRVTSSDSFINATWDNKINIIIDQVFKNVS